MGGKPAIDLTEQFEVWIWICVYGVTFVCVYGIFDVQPSQYVLRPESCVLVLQSVYVILCVLL